MIYMNLKKKKHIIVKKIFLILILLFEANLQFNTAIPNPHKIKWHSNWIFSNC
jgi:hypothetical protein